MDELSQRGSVGVLSEIVDKVSFANFLPLLIRATAENDEPTAGYMLSEIGKITFQPPPHCQQLTEYLNRRLEKPSACVKLKVLKIMLYLIQHGHISFRYYLRRNDGSIKLATMYNGPPDPLLGVTPYETVRHTAKELLVVLFDPDLIQKDDTMGNVSQTDEREKLQLGGLGTTGTSRGKYEGFGNSPIDKEERLKDKMMDMLEKVLNPTDETAEKIKSALTSSPGNYEAVAVDVQIVPNFDSESAQIQERAVKMKAHVPGRAGGGWDSDDEEQDEVLELHKSLSTGSGSIVSVDSLEKIDPSVEEMTPAREIVNEFCSRQEWPLPLSELNEACKKCATLNCPDVLQAVANTLIQSTDKTSDITLTRALLMVEWFVRTDLITPAAISQIMSLPLEHLLKSESTGKDVRMKTKKIRLILDKLQGSTMQPRKG